MKIPKILKKNNKTYTLVEIHEDYVVYKTEFGYNECFNKREIAIKEENNIRPYNLKPQKVSYL